MVSFICSEGIFRRILISKSFRTILLSCFIRTCIIGIFVKLLRGLGWMKLRARLLLIRRLLYTLRKVGELELWNSRLALGNYRRCSKLTNMD